MAPVFAQDPKIFRLIRQGTPQDVAAALAAGANPNAQTADGKHTPLVFVSEIHMSENYRREMIDALMAAGADIDRPAPNGDRPLHAAVRRDDKSLVQFYLDRGAILMRWTPRATQPCISPRKRPASKGVRI